MEQGRTNDGRNYALLQVTPSNLGIYMRIESMSEADPIRDIHVWMPDYKGQSLAGQVWMPDWTVLEANPGRYAGVVFIGGWGASTYQYAFEGT